MREREGFRDAKVQKGNRGGLSSHDCVGPRGDAAAVMVTSGFAAHSLSAPFAQWRLS